MNRDEIYYRAVLARDYRFDGKFFVGVKTTGIYCRPICPARPRRENVEFFSSALACQKRGYRPCLRCRPECAPMSPAWSGKSAVVQRALRLIASRDEQGDISESAFAERLGLSARHLRRVFEQELGQTPKQIAQNVRLGFARKLVVETTLPIAEIAFASGFQSLRRFNDAFLKQFKRSPSGLRRNKNTSSASRFLNLTLSYRPPFDWKSLFHFHQTHPVIGVERFDEGTYERLFCFENSLGVCRVSCDGSSHSKIQLQVFTDNPRSLLGVTRRVRAMFDLDSDPLLIANHFADHPLLCRLHKKYPGLRLPRGWDGFESAVRTILGQLVSVEQGGRLLSQLIRAYGARVTHPISGDGTHLFPTPEVLMNSDLAAVGTTQKRRESIRALAGLVYRGELGFSDAQDLDRVRSVLRAIPGIGPWSTEYMALRAFGDTDAFPATDLILQRALEKHPELNLEHVRPWRSYLAIYLWKEYAGLLSKNAKKRGKSDEII